MRFIFLSLMMTSFSWIYGSLSNLEEHLINHVQESISNAEQHVSKLTPEVLKIPGMSSPKVRHFLNNLCSTPNTRYLEIGCWKGSTFVAAVFGNEYLLKSAIAIDNGTLFERSIEEFLLNCSSLLKSGSYSFYEQDSFKLEISSVFQDSVNVYFYDGDHTELAQEQAFTYYNDIFDDVFVAVVDDWNFPSVPKGTKNAFEKLQYEVLFERVLPARYNGDLENWHNGLYVAVVRKTRKMG